MTSLLREAGAAMPGTGPGTLVVSATQDERVVSFSNDPSRSDSFRANNSAGAYRMIQGDPGSGAF